MNFETQNEHEDPPEYCQEQHAFTFTYLTITVWIRNNCVIH